MDRRSFLRVVTAAIGAVALPSVPATPGVSTEYQGIRFVGPEWWDYHNQVGLAIYLPDGRCTGFRMVCRKYTPEIEAELKTALIQWAQKQYA